MTYHKLCETREETQPPTCAENEELVDNRCVKLPDPYRQEVIDDLCDNGYAKFSNTKILVDDKSENEKNQEKMQLLISKNKKFNHWTKKNCYLDVCTLENALDICDQIEECNGVSCRKKDAECGVHIGDLKKDKNGSIKTSYKKCGVRKKETDKTKDPCYLDKDESQYESWEKIGWREKKDNLGNIYYFNCKTKKTSFEKPKIEEDMEDWELAGWVKRRNRSGREYYYNESTNEYSWTKPDLSIKEEETEIIKETKSPVDLLGLCRLSKYEDKINNKEGKKYKLSYKNRKFSMKIFGSKCRENGCTKEDAEIECGNDISCIGYYCIDSKCYPGKGFN